MQVLRPETVEFNSEPWEGVTSVTVERSASSPVVEHGDLGPHPAFGDAPARTVTVQVTGSADRPWASRISPGDAGLLIFEASLGRTDSGRERVTVACMVTRVKEAWSGDAATRAVTLVGISPDGGASDPVTVTPI